MFVIINQNPSLVHTVRLLHIPFNTVIVEAYRHHFSSLASSLNMSGLIHSEILENEKSCPVEDFCDLTKGNRVEITTRHFPDGCTPHAKGIIMMLKDDVKWDRELFDIILNNKHLDKFSFWKINIFINEERYTFEKEIDNTLWEDQLSDICKLALTYDHIFKPVPY